MLSQQLIKQFGLRFTLLKLCGATYFDWSPESQKVIHANPYFIFMMYFGVHCSYLFPIALLTQIYLQLNPFDDQLDKDPSIFATIVIAWGEIFIGVSLLLVDHTVASNRSHIIYLCNQLLSYNTQILGNL